MSVASTRLSEFGYKKYEWVWLLQLLMTVDKTSFNKFDWVWLVKVGQVWLVQVCMPVVSTSLNECGQ